jgi:hypothetical protein
MKPMLLVPYHKKVQRWGYKRRDRRGQEIGADVRVNILEWKIPPETGQNAV